MLKLRFFGLIIVFGLILGSGCSRQARSQRHLDRANADFRAGKYGSAEIEYLTVLKLVPSQSLAIRQLGVIYHDDGRALQALAFLKKAAELDTNDVDVRVRLGLIYLSFRQFKEASEQASWVLEKKPGDEEAILMLAKTADTPAEIEEMHQRLEKLRHIDRERAIYHVAQGTLYLRQGDLNRAENEIQTALTLDPRSSAVQSVLGSLSWARNDLAAAEQAFKAAANSEPARSPARLMYANFKIKTGAIEDAKKILEGLADQVPDFLPAWNGLMQIAFIEKRFDDCFIVAGNILARDSRNYDALMMRGNLHLVKNEGAEAVKDFEQMNTIYNRVPQVQYQLAVAYLVEGNASKASQCLDQALQIAPNLPEAILLRAELDLRNGSVATAIVSLTRLIKQQPEVKKAHLLLATAYLIQKNPDEALAVYRRMLNLFPKSPDVQTLMGSVLIQQKKFAEARVVLEQSLEITPDYLPTVEQLLNIDILEKKYSAALELVKAQLSRRPQVAALWLLQAKVYSAQNDHLQTESALLKAIQLEPNSRDGYFLLAQVYVKDHREKEALDRLNALITKTNDPVALMQIGMIHQELKQFPEARDAYKKVLAVKPDFIAALNNLAYLYSEHLNQLDEAAELAGRARRLLPDDPFTADTYGWILYRKGDYPHALALIIQSAGKLPDQPEVQAHLGMTHYMLGEEVPARLALQRATQSPVDFPGKEEARSRLTLLNLDVKNAGPDVLQDLEKRRTEAPNDPILLDRLASFYEREGGATDKARAIYEEIRQQNPKNVQATIKLAQLYSTRLNNPAKSLELAKTAHELEPNDAIISGVLGHLLLMNHDYKWAASLLEEASSRIPREPKLRFDLAWAYYGVGRVAEAETAMQSSLQNGASLDVADDANRFLRMTALAKHPFPLAESATQAKMILAATPDYIPALMVTAVVANQQENYSEAKTAYERILAVNPRFPPALKELAVLYSQYLGNDQKAYPLAVLARTLSPGDSEVAKVLGILVYRRADYARAAQLLKESLQLRTKDSELLYYLGMSQYRLNQQNECRQSLNQALALNTLPLPLADEIKRVLAQLR